MALRSFEEASFLRSVGAQASRARRSLGVEVKDCCQAVQELTLWALRTRSQVNMKGNNCKPRRGLHLLCERLKTQHYAGESKSNLKYSETMF